MERNKKQEEPEIPEIIKPLRKENPFVIPHNYFRELPDEVMRRIHEEDQRVAYAPKSWLERLNLWMGPLVSTRPALALAMVVLTVGAFVWFGQDRSDEHALAAGSFEQAELVAYIQEHLDEFDESDFYSDDAAGMDHPLRDDIDESELAPFLDDIIDEVDIGELEDLL